MDKEEIPDLDGWEAYCEGWQAFREARRAQERDVGDGTEYFEFVCNTCHSILLTFAGAYTSLELGKARSRDAWIEAGRRVSARPEYQNLRRGPA